ncbi:MAG: 2-dehydropantoate 2-reductase [Clostridia bacterium]|nr:2-dehydropantoate 2-reductase [Clostridia bacterium]
MRVCIYGAGAMGTVLGAFLARKGVSIDLFGRNERHMQALKENGAKIVGKVDFCVPVSAYFPWEMQGKYDLIFLMTKQRENRSICTFLKDYLAEDGVLCTTQNGLPEEGIASVLGRDRTYGCATAWGANLLSPGEAELTSDPESMSFSLGTLGNGEKLKEIEGLLSLVGAVRIEETLLGARWAKLMINAAFSGLSTVTGLSFGEIAKEKDTRRIAQTVLQEAIDVARAAHIKIEKLQGHDVAKLLGFRGRFQRWISFHLIPIAMKHHASLVSGMLLDLKRGKKTEIDYVTGVVSDYGRKYGVRTPSCDAIVALVHKIEEGELPIGRECLAFFPKETT